MEWVIIISFLIIVINIIIIYQHAWNVERLSNIFSAVVGVVSYGFGCATTGFAGKSTSYHYHQLLVTTIMIITMIVIIKIAIIIIIAIIITLINNQIINTDYILNWFCIELRRLCQSHKLPELDPGKHSGGKLKKQIQMTTANIVCRLNYNSFSGSWL